MIEIPGIILSSLCSRVMSITKIENYYKAVVENKRGKRHIYEFMSAFIKLTPAVIKSSVPKYGMKYTTNRALQNLIRKRTLGYSCKASLAVLCN